MIPPLNDLDDLKPGPTWKRVSYDRELGMCDLSTVSADVEVMVHWDDGSRIALLVRADTLEIVGLHIEDVDFRSLR